MGQTELIIEFPEDIVREVEEILKTRGGTFSDFVNEAIQAALGDLDADTGPPAHEKKPERKPTSFS